MARGLGGGIFGGISGAGGAVASVFGRVGAVIAAINDYAASMITAVAHGSTAATTVQGQLDELTDEKADKTVQINSTAPLSGGGDLSANRSLAIDTFVGDSGSGGSRGVVPAPAAGDAVAGKYLKADGSWTVPPSSGGGGVDSFNGRTGVVTPAQADYDGFFLTPAEGNTAYAASGHNHAGVYEPADAAIQTHITAAHAPANAQKNSDITKAEIEAKLTGEISTHTHAQQHAQQHSITSGTDHTFPGGTTTFLRADGTFATPAASGGGDVVYVPTAADIAINSITDVTIVTRDVTSVAAGDQLMVDCSFIILNNSAATRVYVITLDFDGLFDIEITTLALATSATLMHTFVVDGRLNVRSSSLALGTLLIEGGLAAGLASGGDTTMAATPVSGVGWGSSTSDATGTVTCTLRIRSANAAATQTCRLVNFVIRKVSPT